MRQRTRASTHVMSTTINGGGFEQVFSGAIVSGATISAGEFEVNTAPTAAGTLTVTEGTHTDTLTLLGGTPQPSLPRRVIVTAGR
jgi:autotransporter passenger strand-loop-strand repeat protein